MDYGYKITTHGRAVQAACMDLQKPLKLTRAAVGSGLIDKDEDMAKVHSLIQYAAEASITDRRHEGDRLFLTVRYSNRNRPEANSFTLSEFMVWAEDPETGQETDFLYGTLGDYRQPVPAYSSAFPASTWSYPLVLVVSGDLEVSITASPGLATFEDLLELKAEIVRSIMMNKLTLPLTTTDGEQILTTGGTPIMAVYHPNQSASILAAMKTLDGRLTGQIAAAKAEAISAASTDATAKVKASADDLTAKIATAKMEAVSAAGTAADTKIETHNTAAASHPTHLSIVQKS